MKFMYIKPDFVYSINNRNVIDKKNLIAGSLPTRPGIVYLSVVNFKILQEEVRKNIKSVILNLYVNEIQGNEVVPIEISSEKNNLSKGFLLLRSSVGRYNRLDITSLLMDDPNFELYISVVKNYRSMISFDGMEDSFPLIIQIEYEDGKISQAKDGKDNIETYDSNYEDNKDFVYCNENSVNTSIKDIFELFSVKTNELYENIEVLKKQLSEVKEIKSGVKGEIGPQGPKGDIGANGPIGPKGQDGVLSSNYGYFEVLGLSAFGQNMELRVKLKGEMIEGINFNSEKSVLKVIKAGIYFVAYTISITTLILSVPSLYLKINEVSANNAIRGAGLPHQVLASNRLMKLKVGDELSLCLDGAYEKSVIEGNMFVFGINFN